MVEYTYQQKIAIMRILLDIIHADGIIDARETFFFEKLKDEFQLAEEDHEVVKKKNSLLALTQIKLLDEEQKEHFAKLMAQMIIVDEDINVNEVAIYNVVSEFCAIRQRFDNIVPEQQRNKYTKI
ncbi:MAG: hypothetical protein IJ142_06815 [Bacteroidaceae bacterium]|nr:hypothetical protein [Bacteroidaceae bacterium]